MKKIILILGILVFFISCNSQDSFRNSILKINSGNKIFMNNKSIELLNKIDSSMVNKAIRKINFRIKSTNELIIKLQKSIIDIERGRLNGQYSNYDANDLTSDVEKLINECKNNINNNNERIILLNKLIIGGYKISITRTDNITPTGFYIPEWFIIDENYKFICSSHDLPSF